MKQNGKSPRPWAESLGWRWGRSSWSDTGCSFGPAPAHRDVCWGWWRHSAWWVAPGGGRPWRCSRVTLLHSQLTVTWQREIFEQVLVHAFITLKPTAVEVSNFNTQDTFTENNFYFKYTFIFEKDSTCNRFINSQENIHKEQYSLLSKNKSESKVVFMTIVKIATWRSRSSQIAGSSRQHNSCCYATMQHLMTSFCNIWWHHLYDLHILDFEDTKVNIISQVVYNFSQIKSRYRSRSRFCLDLDDI